MHSTDLALTLRFTAQLLDGLPGLPPVFTFVHAGSVALQVADDGADEHQRTQAVDMICAILGLTPEQHEHLGRSTYEGIGTVGGISVHVYAPGCHAVRDLAEVRS